MRPFLFHIYDPTWETPLDFSAKEFGMIYVGHTKFRWHGMSQVLRGDRAGARQGRPRRPRRRRLGRTRSNGRSGRKSSDDYYVDRDYLKQIGVEALPPVPYPEVIATMSRGIFNPVIYRPLFERLGIVTCRTFETPAAGTIPLFLLDPDYVRSIYGDAAVRAGARRRAPAREDRRRRQRGPSTTPISCTASATSSRSVTPRRRACAS